LAAFLVFKKVCYNEQVMKNKFKILFFGFLIFFPLALFAAMENIDNAGFVPGPIWFSKYPVFVGDEVKIYTALYNNSEYGISGDLYFYNNNKEIGKANFKMPANSGAKDVWIEWIALKGDVEISAEMKNVLIMDFQEKKNNNIGFQNAQIAKSKIFIDFDNDKDGIGNIKDNDDDNDGVSDLTEIAEGTNPFEADHKISTSTSQEELVEKKEEKTFADKIDQSIMGFLGKITKNKLDNFVDNLSNVQAEKILSKKTQLEETHDTNKSFRLDTIKSSFSSKNSVVNRATSSSVSPLENKNQEIKNGIIQSTKDFFSKIFIYILGFLIFLLKHPTFLFLFIFFLIYLAIKKLVRFFVD